MKAMQTPTPSQAATSPIQTPKPPVSITMVAPDGKTLTLPVPRTESEVRQLLAQREELSDQLTSVSARRSELASDIRNRSVEATRTGLEERLRLLDNRILQLETDLASTGRQIASAPSDLIAGTEPARPPGGGGDFEEGIMIGGFSVFLVLSVAFSSCAAAGSAGGLWPPFRPSWVVNPLSVWSDWRTGWKRLPSRSSASQRASDS